MKYCIGGGLSGLIWSLYNPEYKIVTPEIGGMATKNKIIWLHNQPETRHLLKTLGWTNVEKLAKKSYIGYFQDSWITNTLSGFLNTEIIQKKMSNWNDPINTEFVPQNKDLSLAVIGGDNYLSTLNVNMVELVDKLHDRAKVISGNVIELIPSHKVFVVDSLGESSQFEYDHLVSTIPAPVFWKLYRQEKKFKSLPITNVTTKTRPPVFDDKYEMVYYGQDQKFSRISNLGGCYNIEFTGVITQEEFRSIYPALPIEEHSVIKYGRIFSDETNTAPPNVKFLGRFAQWNHRITAEWVVKDTLDYKKINN